MSLEHDIALEVHDRSGICNRDMVVFGAQCDTWPGRWYPCECERKSSTTSACPGAPTTSPRRLSVACEPSQLRDGEVADIVAFLSTSNDDRLPPPQGTAASQAGAGTGQVGAVPSAASRPQP